MGENETPPLRMDTCGSFGEFLRQLRLEKSLSQRDLAEGICFRTYVSEIERGDRFPAPTVLAGFAARLAVPLEHLAGPYLASPMAGISQRLALARQLAEHGGLEAAQGLLSSCGALLEREPKPQGYVADLLETEALISYKSDRLEDALEQFRMALQIRRKARARRYPLARACFRYGLVALHAGHEATAQQALFDAFETILSVDPSAVPESRERVADMHLRVVQALGHLLLKVGNLQGALYVYRLALTRWQAYDISVQTCPDISLGHALAEMETGNLNEARRMLTQLLDAPQPTSVLVRVHNNLGLLHRLGGNWDDAAREQQEAWALLQATGDGEPLPICNELVHCALHAGNWATAGTWLQRSLGHRHATGSNAHLAEAYLLGVKFALARGDAAAAQRYLAEAAAVPGTPLVLLQKLQLEGVRLAHVTGDHHSLSAAIQALENTLSVAH